MISRFWRNHWKNFNRRVNKEQIVSHAIWFTYAQSITEILQSLSVTDRKGRSLEIDRAFSVLAEKTVALKKNAGTLFLLGNGASASMASHGAADLMKNGGIRCMVLTDPALLTAWSNDLHYVQAFAEPLRICSRPGDALAVISSSGRSPNLLAAVDLARRGGISPIITISAMDADNPLRASGDLNFYVPAPSFSLAESAHAAVLHHWIDQVAFI